LRNELDLFEIGENEGWVKKVLLVNENLKTNFDFTTLCIKFQKCNLFYFSTIRFITRYYWTVYKVLMP